MLQNLWIRTPPRAEQHCTTWVWQPSTTHCWFVAHATGTRSRADRVVGYTTPAPTPPPPALPYTIWVTQYGRDTLRLRIGPAGAQAPIATPVGAVLPNPLGDAAKTISWSSNSRGGSSDDGVVSIANGALRATIDGAGMVAFAASAAGAAPRALLTLASVAVGESTSTGNISGYYAMRTTWTSEESEKLWGLGERAQSTLDNKGRVIDFKTDQHNTRWTIPFLLSSKKYGFFWNHPGWGGVDMSAANATAWSAIAAKQLDVLVYAPSGTASGASPYADLTARHCAGPLGFFGGPDKPWEFLHRETPQNLRNVSETRHREPIMPNQNWVWDSKPAKHSIYATCVLDEKGLQRCHARASQRAWGAG